MDASSREAWIREDVIRQIQVQFQLLWKQLEIEIKVCRDEKFRRPIPHRLTDNGLISQYNMCQQLVSISKEAALLMLGRLEELWLLKAMGRIKSFPNEKILPLAELKGLIDKSNKRLFRQIRTQYNRLKH